MKLCDRCRVPCCLLDYGGKACQEARKKYCPDVVFTHADKIREMDDEALAFIIMCPRDDGNKCKNSQTVSLWHRPKVPSGWRTIFKMPTGER